MQAFGPPRAILALSLTLGLLTGTASGEKKYYTDWDNAYPTSSADDNVINGTGKSCQLCHRDVGGDEPFNGYGWKMRELINSGMSVPQAIAGAESFDSDGNGDSNLTEIQADTQPGWTPGGNNTIYFKSGFQQTGQFPPSQILGDLDPLACGTVVSYCTAGTSASGCQASLSTSGTPSATAATGFLVMAGGVEGAKDGLFFFGTNGRQANSWGNGASFQCVVPPVKRAGILSGVGTNGMCDGSFSQDLNALWQASPAKNPGAGALVQAQLWYRDPQNTSSKTTSLSNAIEFQVCP